MVRHRDAVAARANRGAPVGTAGILGIIALGCTTGATGSAAQGVSAGAVSFLAVLVVERRKVNRRARGDASHRAPGAEGSEDGH
jgi:hypothetical protein